MTSYSGADNLRDILGQLARNELSALDFLPDGSLAEKMINLVLTGPPPGVPVRIAGLFQETLASLRDIDTAPLRIVTLGGGTGLSNIIGGDSRKPDWAENPFNGLKEIFPGIASIVCVTDDGGSTGELLKDLPLIALGDLRHVLLSSVRRENLQSLFGVDAAEAQKIISRLHWIFNYRFSAHPASAAELERELPVDGIGLPEDLNGYLQGLVRLIYTDQRLRKTLEHPQCLGNLLLAAAIFSFLPREICIEELTGNTSLIQDATLQGLADVAERIGAGTRSVLPCTTIPAQLQVLYSNGVLVTGEYKSSLARRGYPVDRVLVDFFQKPRLLREVSEEISNADIIIFAPGSLYSSIIPILQVPGITELIRRNTGALKILISNIWVQKGETDAARDAPERKFHVSDLVRAYNRNIPGGLNGLCTHILTLGMAEIPGSVLQSYALEEKEPIYLDRENLQDIGFEPVETDIFSTDLLRRSHVIQHDPTAVAQAVRTLWCMKIMGKEAEMIRENPPPEDAKLKPHVRESCHHPCLRYRAINDWLASISFLYAENGSGEKRALTGPRRDRLHEKISTILWEHPDILHAHLKYTSGIVLVQTSQWFRCQQWDNIFSFYAPPDRTIVIREDQFEKPARFEMAFLVALGQSLLGDYAQRKTMEDISEQRERIGRVFRLELRPEAECNCFFTPAELDTYLQLSRMKRSEHNPRLYTRLVNSDEGFTPPGLLFGLLYTWYLDNRFASHIEYKMSIMRNTVSDLIPEQARIFDRREGLIDFFRETVFRHNLTRRKQN